MNHGGLILGFLLLVLVIAWYVGGWGFSLNRQEGMASLTAPTGMYEMSKAHIHASGNEVDEAVVTVDSRGHITESRMHEKVFSSAGGHCLPGSVYNSATHGCDCSAGFTYSTRLGCLSDCASYETYVTTGGLGGGGSCAPLCTDPNQYYNTTTRSCQACPVGYQVGPDMDNVCTAMTACELNQVYDASGNCKSCPEGQVGDADNQCVSACLDFQTYNSLTGECMATCPGHNRYMDMTTGQCRTCPPGMMTDSHNQCVVAPECPPGMRLDANAQCVNQCLVWETYDAALDVCLPQCNVQNSAGFYTQYLDLERTDACVPCGSGMISDGNNGCMQGPTLPAPTCPAGYVMNRGNCEMTCAPWRKYDVHTDSCILRCPSKTQHWDDTAKGCINCPTGFQVDGFNQCIVGIPVAPVYNTPAPTCAPGYVANSKGVCVSECPAFATNNAYDPLVCDKKCPGENQYWDATNPTTCGTCPNGYVSDEHGGCNDCDVLADYIPAMYKQGTLGYTPVADKLPGETASGYTCEANCAVGYLLNTDVASPGYNTCSVCNTAPNPTLFISKYRVDSTPGSSTQGQCMPMCSAPNLLNADNYDPAHPCNLCVTGYTTDMVANNPNLVQADVDPNLRRCMPAVCNTGYIIGDDFTCSACDTANGYTNDVTKITTKMPGVNYSNPGKKCFPITCPNNAALGPDLTCSVCAPGFYGTPAGAGCAPPQDDIKVVSVDKVHVGNVTFDGTLVNVDTFTLDFTLSIALSNYAYANVTLAGTTRPLSRGGAGQKGQSGNVTFSGVKLTTEDLPLTVNYYDNAGMTGKPVATSSYALNYTANVSTASSTPVQTGDFAVGYLLIGGGAGGGTSTMKDGGTKTTDPYPNCCAVIGDDCTICCDTRFPQGAPFHRRC